MFNDSLPSRINVVLVMAYGSLVSLFNVVCAGLIQTETMNAVPGYRGLIPHQRLAVVDTLSKDSFLLDNLLLNTNKAVITSLNTWIPQPWCTPLKGTNRV